MVDASPGTVPPQPGTPATPAGGWRQQPSPWRPQPLPLPQRPAEGSEAARGGEAEVGEKERKEKVRALQRLTGELLLRPPGWSAAGSGRKERAGAEAGSRGGASLRDAARRRKSCARWGPAGGSRAQAPGGGAVPPEPTPASPASPLWAAAQPPAAPGSLLVRHEQKRARGPAAADSSRHAPAGTPPEGRRGGGEREARGRRAGGRRGGRGTGRQGAAGAEPSGRRSPASPCPAAAPRASTSRPQEGSREGGGGSAHAARSFRRRRRCPNRGRPREKEAK